MIELEVQIARQKHELGKENADNNGLKPWTRVNHDLDKFLRKSCSDLQKQAGTQRNAYQEINSKHLLRNFSIDGHQRSFARNSSRRASTGRGSSIDFMQRNKDSLSNWRVGRGQQRVFRI